MDLSAEPPPGIMGLFSSHGFGMRMQCGRALRTLRQMNAARLFAGAAVLMLLAAAATAYAFRYVPVQGDGSVHPVTLWDRWEQRVCLVSFDPHHGTEWRRCGNAVSKLPEYRAATK